MRFTEACIRRPLLAWVLTASVILAGVLGVARMGVSQSPDSQAPMLQVTLTWPGASPEEVERDVAPVAEDALMQVQGLQHVTAVSRSETVELTLELAADTPVDAALQDAQMQLSAVERRFPLGVRPPILSKSSTQDAPVMWFVVAGPLPPRQLSDVVRRTLKGALQAIPGVGEVMIFGQRSRQVRIWVDGERLQQHGLSVDDITQALAKEHVSLPAGQFTGSDQHVALRVSSEAETLEDLADMPVRAPSGMPLRLRDVAVVEDGVADETVRARLDGQPAQGIGLKKQRGANVVQLAQDARAAVAHVQTLLPAGVHIETLYDASRSLQHTLQALMSELLLAVLFTVAVCRLFLGTWQSAISAFWALPMSLLGACAVIACCGFTLNTVTVLALTVAVGMVLDDAIMVLESIHRQHAGRMSASRAAARGTRRVLKPALAATLTVVIIFAPVLALEGRTARDLLEFGVTVSVAVLLSLLEAITLAPARSSHFLARLRQPAKPARRWEVPIRRALTAAWSHPRRTAAFSGLVCLLAVAAYLHVRALPPVIPDTDVVSLHAETAAGTPLERTAAATAEAERRLRAVPGVQRVLTLMGERGPHTAQLVVLLQPVGQRAPYADLAPLLDAAVRAAPDLKLSQGATGDVELELVSSDWAKLHAGAMAAQSALRALPQVHSAEAVDATLVPELHLLPERQRCQDAGVTMEHLARTVKALVGGLPVGKFSLDGKRVDMWLRLRADQRKHDSDLQSLTVRGSRGEGVALGELATLQHRRVLQQLTRVDKQRLLRLRVQPVSQQNLPATRAALLAEAQAAVPHGVHVRSGIDAVAHRDSRNTLKQAIGLGAVLAAMVLVVQFNGVRVPLLILSFSPFAAAGAVLALAAAGQPLSDSAWLGVVLLFGLVKKNAIVLLDRAERWRRRGYTPANSVARAARRRLRPIVMTSTATAVAMLPAALGLGPGGSEHRGLAVVVVGGVVLCTVLCLGVLPLAYTWIWRLRLGRRDHEVHLQAPELGT